MDGPMTLGASQSIVKHRVCGVCEGNLINPWGGSRGIDGQIVVCVNDDAHKGTKPRRRTRRLADGQRYNVYAQQPVDKFEREGIMATDEFQRTEIPTRDADAAITTRPLTMEQFDQRIELIDHVVSKMKDGVHYGAIPGTQGGKSLWEPGAEFLRAAFNIQWDHEFIEEVEDYDKWIFKYTVRAFQILAPGVTGVSWTASAYNRERKFWCRSECPRPCTQGHEPSMEREMHPHNVRDRALKRGFVALMRNVTGTTGHFQLVEGDDEPVKRELPRPTRRCEEHNAVFRRQENERGVWYSHRQGDKYHNADKSLVDQWETPDAPDAPIETPKTPGPVPERQPPAGVDPATGAINDDPDHIFSRPPEDHGTRILTVEWLYEWAWELGEYSAEAIDVILGVTLERFLGMNNEPDDVRIKIREHHDRTRS